MTFFSPVPWEADKFYAQPGMAESNLSINYWPVGTGPYMLTEYQENRRHVLSRNPNFRGEPYPCEGETGDKDDGLLADCGKLMPFIDKIVFSIEKEKIPQKTKFLQGYYDIPSVSRFDWFQDLDYDVKNSKEIAKVFRENGIQMPTTIEISNWYLGFNWFDPVVGKGETPRGAGTQPQAAAGAVDRDRLGRVRRDVREQGGGRTRDERGAAVRVRLSDGARQSQRSTTSSTASRGASRSRRRSSCSPRPAIPTGATRRPASRWCSTSTTSAR